MAPRPDLIIKGDFFINIFVLDRDPKRCAKYHHDKHVLKMILESAQMLCTAHEREAPYKSTHENHPCNVWVRESLANYNWLLELGQELAQEYTYRYNKVHKTTQVLAWCRNYKPDLPDNGLTERPQAMPDKYKKDNVVKAYRNYYIGEKVDGASWTDRERPNFVEVANE